MMELTLALRSSVIFHFSFYVSPILQNSALGQKTDQLLLLRKVWAVEKILSITIITMTIVKKLKEHFSMKCEHTPMNSSVV